MFGRLVKSARGLGMGIAAMVVTGGVAAAAQNGLSLVSSGSVTSSASPSVTPTPTPKTHSSKHVSHDAKPAASPSSTVSLPPCPADVKNHGQYVSSVAHSAGKGKGKHHGATVSAAAHSSCGKPSPSATESKGTESEPSEAPDSEAPKSEAPQSEAPESPEPSETPDADESGTGN